MSTLFELQGHRGARGLKPENTLPSFEAAFDHGVASIETDLHLTLDGVVVLCHDPLMPDGMPICRLTLAQLRGYRVDRNPDPQRFPGQNSEVTPVAALFAEERGLDPFAIPTISDLFAFAGAYSGEPGRLAGKTDKQRAGAKRALFDLELKRIPFHPEAIGDDYRGGAAGLLEWRIVEAARAAEIVERTRVRSFDHRCVRALREIEPGIEGAVLVAETAVVDPAAVARRAWAAVYCPNYHFLDEVQVSQAHAGGARIIPWTVNDAAAWQRLLAWGVDGITTDYPDRLAAYMQNSPV